MHIEHAALWTEDIERLRAFYETYFGGQAGQLYTNPARGFRSYFLSFAAGARLEIMQMEGIPASTNDRYAQFGGLVHLAFSAGSKAEVDWLTARLEAGGFERIDGPRTTGDGYYESSFFDPDGNRLEITI